MADDYASHYAVLAAATAKGAGQVLELGCGEGSTPMLHYICKMTGRVLTTLETDATWLKKYEQYRSQGHRLYHVTDWDRLNEYLDHEAWFSVVFVDNAPGESRVKLISRLKDRARFIIAHDSERDWGTGANYRYETVKPMFKYVTEFRRWRPYTLILSNLQPFEIDECDRTWKPSPEQLANYQKEGIKE